MYVFVFYGKANPSFTEVLCFYPTKLAKLLVICEIMVFMSACQNLIPKWQWLQQAIS